MKEILFRGKRIDDGRWTCGYFVGRPWGAKNPIIVKSAEYDDWNNVQIDYEFVEKETVGQYTGLTDKNGMKIFEGDIVKCTDANNGYDFTAVVLFGNPNGEYNWGFQLQQIGDAGARDDILFWVDMEETGAFIEVVGNIHDNPELLKGEGE